MPHRTNAHSFRFLPVIVAAALLLSGWWMTGRGAAFTNRDLVVLNVVMPAVAAGWRAHKRRNPVGPAILQGLAGGLLMHKAL